MLVNHLHDYMREDPFIFEGSGHTVDQRIRLQNKEGDRIAFRNRMNFWNMTQSYNGNAEFPYSAIDLACFMK